MRKTLIICLITLISTACTIKTLYNQLDWLIADRLESYVELTSEQQTRLYANIQRTLAWHRSNQLPLYVKWLQEFKSDILGTATQQNIGLKIDQFQLFLRAIRAHSANEMARLLPLLSAEQRQQIYRHMDEENEKFADRYIEVDRDEQIDVYAERMEKQLESWLGSLNDKQESIVQASAKQIQPVATEVLASRHRWQAEFRDILENHHKPKIIADKLQDLLVNIEKQRSVNYKKLFAHNRQVLIQLIIDIASSMDSPQRAYLTDKVDTYSQYFTELANEAKLSTVNQ
jgi:hypothetical protein